MAPECAVCGTETAVSDACPHCGVACCPDHRSPAAHDCPGTEAGTTGGWRLDLDGVPAGTRDGVSAGTNDGVSAGTNDGVPADANGDSSDGDPSAEPSLSGLFRPGIGLAVVTLVLVVGTLVGIAYVGPIDDGLDAGGVETHVEDETNEARLAAGVGAVESDADLAAVARAHSRDMRDRGFVDHTNPDGEGPTERVSAAGLDCSPGENVYQTPRGAVADGEAALADHVVRSWLDSPGHRRTLLGAGYERQGVGVAVGDDAVFVTQLFC